MPDLKEIVNNRKEQQRLAEREKNARKQLDADVKEVLGTPSGRRVFKALLSMAPASLPCVTEPYKDAFTLGRMSFATDVRRLIDKNQLRQIEDQE